MIASSMVRSLEPFAAGSVCRLCLATGIVNRSVKSRWCLPKKSRSVRSLCVMLDLPATTAATNCLRSSQNTPRESFTGSSFASPVRMDGLRCVRRTIFQTQISMRW